MLVDTTDLVSVTELGRNLSRFVNEAAAGQRRFVILNSNTPTAALVSIADLERLNALDAAPSSTPDIVVELDRPAPSDLQARPGYSAVGRSADGEPVCWPLSGHVIALGRPGAGLGHCFSAAIAGAVPDPQVPTEFVVATPNSFVSLRHDRLHPEIPIAVALDLREPVLLQRFAERLRDEIDRRKHLLRELHVETVDELRQLGLAELAAQVPNMVVALIDSDDELTAGRDRRAEADVAAVLSEVLTNGSELGIYLWFAASPIGTEPGSAAAASKRSIARRVSFRVLLGSVESPQQSREMLGSEAAAWARVPAGAGWCVPGRGADVLKFAVASPTGGPGEVVTASGTCTSWRPWLTQPLALVDIPATSRDTEAGLTFPIGATNPPWEALTVSVNDKTPHLCFVGGRDEGCGRVLETVIAAALLRYAPDQCAFLVIDDDGGLAETAELGNVAGYAPASDAGAVERILGEALRIMAIRRARFAADMLTTFDEYTPSSRSQDHLGHDPYGRLIVVIAGLGTVGRDKQSEAAVLDILQSGGRVGVHVVATTWSTTLLPEQAHPHVSFPLMFAGTHAGEVPSVPLQTMVRAIPQDQPGRCVDVRTGRHGRIAEPLPGNYLGQPLGDPVPRVEMVPHRVDGESFWQHVAASDADGPATDQRDGRRAAAQVGLPLGLGVADYQVVDVPTQRSPHLVVVGEAGSGRTATMRALIESIRRRFSPDGRDGRPEAKVVVIDEYGGLAATLLAADGYLLTSDLSPTAGVEAVAAIVAERTPSPEAMPSSQALRDQSWYDGPEVFVVIDTGSLGTEALRPATPGDWVSTLESIAQARRDLGVHIYLSDTASEYAMKRVSHRVLRMLADAPTLLLSGQDGGGAIWGGSGIRFVRRPSGRGLLVDPGSLHTQTIQIPWYPEADERLGRADES